LAVEFGQIDRKRIRKAGIAEITAAVPHHERVRHIVFDPWRTEPLREELEDGGSSLVATDFSKIADCDIESSVWNGELSRSVWLG
jgi:phage terminase large subunit-like protein